MTGINTVIMYSSNLFKIAGFKAPLMGTASVGVVNLASTIASMFLVGE